MTPSECSRVSRLGTCHGQESLRRVEAVLLESAGGLEERWIGNVELRQRVAGAGEFERDTRENQAVGVNRVFPRLDDREASLRGSTPFEFHIQAQRAVGRITLDALQCFAEPLESGRDISRADFTSALMVAARTKRRRDFGMSCRDEQQGARKWRVLCTANCRECSASGRPVNWTLGRAFVRGPNDQGHPLVNNAPKGRRPLVVEESIHVLVDISPRWRVGIDTRITEARRSPLSL
jgi:hypothetical protein